MSGFEVAGIVLGSIPLIISALEHYRSGTQMIVRWKNYRQMLRTLALQLQTEHSILENTCETLLTGIVPSSQIKAMIADPFGEQWNDQAIKDQLYWKLDTSLDIFEEGIQEMKVLIEMLQRELDAHIPQVRFCDVYNTIYNPLTPNRMIYLRKDP